MNGRVSKRIRRASAASGIPAKELKRQYRELPYHQRRIAGVGKVLSHAERAAKYYG